MRILPKAHPSNSIAIVSATIKAQLPVSDAITRNILAEAHLRERPASRK
jgi:hypothetical protein